MRHHEYKIKIYEIFGLETKNNHEIFAIIEIMKNLRFSNYISVLG